jgi:hypothetical protein
VNLQFEITRRFEKDLARFPTADQRRLAASTDRYGPTFRTSRTRFPGNFAGGLSALLACLDSQYLSRELSHLANDSF